MQQVKIPNWGKLVLGILAVVLLGWGILKLFFYKYVQPDEIGVWMTNGGQNGLSDYQKWEGHFPVDFNPMTKSFVLPAQPWTIDPTERTVYSKQKGEWTIDPQFTFKVNRDMAPFVCFRNNSLLKSSSDADKEKFLTSVGNYLLQPIVYDVFVEAIATRTDSTLMSNTYYYQKLVEDSVRVRFKRVGYDLETFVSNLNPPRTIIAKNRAKNESESAALTAKADVIKAEAEAKVKIATAHADAEAMLVTERANAEVLRLKQNALSPLVIQQQWIEKWDGALPGTMTGTTGLMQMIK